MRRSLVKFSESEASNHTPSLADFTTTTPELKFSVHTTGAALEVSNQIGIPAKFTLVVPEDGIYLPCNVVRRSGYWIGVAFD